MKRQLLRLIYAFYQGIIDFTEAETLQRNLNWQSFAASANVPSRSAVTKNLTGYSQMCETLNLDFRCFAVKFFFGCLFYTATPDSLGHMAQMLALGFDF